MKYIHMLVEAVKSLVQAFVISRIDYCNAILYGLPAIHVNRLQRVQNAAARLLTNTQNVIRTLHL